MVWWFLFGCLLIGIGLISAFGWPGAFMALGLLIILLVIGHAEDQKRRL